MGKYIQQLKAVQNIKDFFNRVLSEFSKIFIDDLNEGNVREVTTEPKVEVQPNKVLLKIITY